MADLAEAARPSGLLSPHTGRMPLYRDEAIVLRTTDLGEADRIVTLLTRGHGKVRAVAKGVRRTLSRFGARLEPFSRVDAQFAEGRSLDIVTQAVGLAPYGEPLAADYARFASGSAMAELADRITESEPTPAQFVLLGSALGSLARQEHDPTITFDSYALRAVSIAGWSPSLDACARCGAGGEFTALSVAAGGVVCDDCRTPDVPVVGVGVIDALRWLRAGAWVELAGVPGADLDRADAFVRAYAQFVLERRVRSLRQLGRRS